MTAHKLKILCSFLAALIIVASLHVSGTMFSPTSNTTSYELTLTVQTESTHYGFGETAKVYGNLVDPNGTAIQDAKIAIEVRNPRNNTVFLDIVFTSVNGTYAASFKLDSNTLLGEHHVYVTANAAGHPIAYDQTTFTVTTVATLSETSFSESTLNETLLTHHAIMNGVTVSGNLTGTLNFTHFEIVNITTGHFAGKGFSKGEWDATLEGISYSGNWEGMLFIRPSERRIYLKGAISGEILGTAEGYISESVNGSGLYDRYQAVWKVGRLHTAIVSATVNLNGTIVYQSSSEFPSTGLYVLQTSIEGSAVGHYNCSLSSMLTHVRISGGTPHDGEGFSIISYVSNYGVGEGWTYDRLASSGTVQMKGHLTNPLYGIVYATLNETTLPRTLHMYIERVDLGLPPTADLKLRIWGPERVSPGQTITYTLELRNDGFKSAENVTVVNEFPWVVDYVSSTANGVFVNHFREVNWCLNIPAKSRVTLAAQGRVIWGLAGNTFVGGFSKIPNEVDVIADPTMQTTFETLYSNQSYCKVEATIANQSESVSMTYDLSITKVAEKVEPAIEMRQISEDMIELTYQFAFESSSYDLVKWKLLFNIDAIPFVYSAIKSQPKYRDMTARYWEERTRVDNLYKIGRITDENFRKDWVALNDQIYLLQTFGKDAAAFPSLTGPIVGLFPMVWDMPIRRIAQRSRMNLIAIYDLDLYFDLYEGFHKSQVVVASDPNLKYGFEGYVSAGQLLNYTVEYENEGEGIAFGVYFTDTLDENLDDSTLEIGPVFSTKDGSIIANPGTYNPDIRTITWLVGEVGPGEGGYANFTVKVRNAAPEGTEIINFATVYFPSVPETNRTNSIVCVVGKPNIAITDLTPSKNIIQKGSALYINVIVVNEGYFAETLNVTFYANSTAIKTQNVTLAGRNTEPMLYVWNTTDFALGNYTIWAYAEPVPNETNIEDNTLVGGWVVVASHGWEHEFTAPAGHPIVDFAVYNGSLYAAADDKLYVKNDSSWSVIDAPTFVISLEPYEDKLVVGSQGDLYCYDGTSFDLIFSVPTYIKVLGAYNGTFYAGTMLDNPPTLYYCNGSIDNPSDWHVDTGFSAVLGFSGPFGSIDSFAVYDNMMYVGSGGKLYSFNGTGWSIAASYNDVYAFLDMQVYDGKLYLATRDQAWRKPLFQGGSGFSGRIIEYDGESWTTIFDHDYWMYSLGVYDGKLYAGTANKIFTFNGTAWETSFATEGAYYTLCFENYDEKIFAGMGNGHIFADPAPANTDTETETIPELQPTMLLPLFTILSAIAIAFQKKKRLRKTQA